MNEMACRDLGKSYAFQAWEFFKRERGSQEIELSEIELLYASAVSWMTAEAFVFVLEKAGPEEAERFLSLVMAGTSACVRLKKAPFMLTMSAKIASVDDDDGEEEAASAQPIPEAPAAAPQSDETCSCRLVDGECPTCPKALKRSYFDLSTFVLSYLRDMASKADSLSSGCKPCGARYVDRAVSELVKEGISKTLDHEPEVLKQQALAIALQTVAVFGISEAPLTVQALRERQG